MKTKQTVTICIPAYNEAKNLQRLLPSLLKQRTYSYTLLSIIIASDASTDNVKAVIEEIDDKRLVLIEGRERKGVAFRQNQLLSQASSDIVVLLNADIAVVDLDYITKLINPIMKNIADITSSALMETKPRNLFEKALYVSMQAKKYAFNKFKEGNNVYTCRGPARAFRKDLYKIMRFNSGIGEDAYSYLFALSHGFRFVAVQDAQIYYSLPSSFNDHKRQSIRFIHSKSNFVSKFGEKFVREEYDIPSEYILEAVIRYSAMHPFYMLWYFLIFANINIRSLFKSVQSETWEVVTSSKLLNL